jgi:chaperonin GroEL (HSP60 family)
MVTYNRGPELVVKVTKDPVEVTRELAIEYPSVKIVAEAAEIHRAQVGDGVIRLMILFSSLLEKSEELIARDIHPNVILDGFCEAEREARLTIDEASEPFGEGSPIQILEAVDCGRNLVNAKLRKGIVEAVRNSSVNGVPDLRRVRIMKKVGGSTDASDLIRGIVCQKRKLHPNMSDVIVGPRIALVASGLAARRLEVKMPGEGVFPFSIDIRDEKDISRFKEEVRKMKIDLVSHLVSTGANVVICRSQIPDDVGWLMADRGIFALSSVDVYDFDSISSATGAKPVGRVEDLEESDVGRADRLETGKNGDLDIVTLYSQNAATFLLRGGLSTAVDELERSVKEARTVAELSTRAPRFVAGAGAIEMLVARRVRKLALRFSSRQQLAVVAFAESVEEIPTQMAVNFGLDPIDTMSELRKTHAEGNGSYGVFPEGCADALKAGVVELAAVPKNFINRAYELALLTLRIDHLLLSTDIAKVHKQ